jgi:hypothetical protein
MKRLTSALLVPFFFFTSNICVAEVNVTDGIKLIEVGLSYEGTKNTLGNQKTIYQPLLQFSVENTGNTDLDYLTFKAIFYMEDNKKKIFGDTMRYVISSSDIPIEPGYQSKTTFLKSDMGYVYNGNNLLNITKRSYIVKLYYKKNYSDKWQKHSTHLYPFNPIVSSTPLL